MLTPDYPLWKAIDENPELIPLAGRFGIRLGVGDVTIGQAALAHGIDADFLVTVMRTFLDDRYFPIKKLRAVELSQIVDYLHKTNAYYLRMQLPNIERHLRAFIATGGSENYTMQMLSELFVNFKTELESQIKHDQQAEFPTILAGGTTQRSNDGSAEMKTIELLVEMRNIIIRYMEGDYDMNLCFGVIFALTTLQRDMAQHERIRSRILYRNATTTSTQSAGRHGKQLTGREIDVLKLVVRGMINREIAERLCISFQTVLTHRKNIAAKLGIKSISGLTMYAIMNGYISAEGI